MFKGLAAHTCVWSIGWLFIWIVVIVRYKRDPLSRPSRSRIHLRIYRSSDLTEESNQPKEIVANFQLIILVAYLFSSNIIIRFKARAVALFCILNNPSFDIPCPHTVSFHFDKLLNTINT